jgi:hypothetical protein
MTYRKIYRFNEIAKQYNMKISTDRKRYLHLKEETLEELKL